jgi:hypothetical protein
MNENEELALRKRLIEEDAGRDRTKFTYTYDALPHLMTWPESHGNVRGVISGSLDYDNLPFELENEAYKGIACKDQCVIVMANQGKEPLCEALDMQNCRKEGCSLYITPGEKDSEGNVITKVPLCREFKMAFCKSS